MLRKAQHSSTVISGHRYFGVMLAVGFAYLGLGNAGCGGSSSETPPPLRPSAFELRQAEARAEAEVTPDGKREGKKRPRAGAEQQAGAEQRAGAEQQESNREQDGAAPPTETWGTAPAD